MGDEFDYAQSQWDSMGRPSLEELEQREEQEEADRQSGASQTRWNERGYKTAEEVAAGLETQALAVKAADPNHVDCPRGARYDFEHGVICGGCGTILEHAPFEKSGPLPPSEVTAAVRDGRQPRSEPAPYEVSDASGLASKVHAADPIFSALEVIDPTQPYDSAMVEKHMLDVMARLERGSHFQRVCEEQHSHAAMAYEMAKARAIVAAHGEGGAKDVREAKAMIVCEQEFLTAMVAKLKVDAVRATMHTLRSELSGYQSINRSIMSTYSGGGSNGQPTRR